MNGTVHAVYFSPTHATRKVAEGTATALAHYTGKPLSITNLTPPTARSQALSLSTDDVLIFGFPVYGGRIPSVLDDALSKLHGESTPAVAIACYGNRDYDDALLEAKDLLESKGFVVIAAAAFIGEHSYTAKVGTDRPNKADLSLAAKFGTQIAEKLAVGDMSSASVKGNHPYRDRMPPSPFRPDTSDACTQCGACVNACPMGIIHTDDPGAVDAGCLVCEACVKVCPVGAKQFHAEPIQQFAAVLEAKFAQPKQPELMS